MSSPTRLHPTTTASLVDHLDLFIGDLSGEAVDRHVHPVTLFAFRHAFEICSGGINTELCWIHIQTTDRTQSHRLAEPGGSKRGRTLPIR